MDSEKDKQIDRQGNLTSIILSNHFVGESNFLVTS